MGLPFLGGILVNQRDVVWIRIPFPDLQRHKARPALVVSNDVYNEENPDVVVCAVTSNVRPAPYKVPLAEGDIETGGLPLAGMVRADKILQVEKALIDRPLARLTPDAYGRVEELIRALAASR